MTLRIGKAKRDTVELPIFMDAENYFKIIVRRPTYDELTEDHGYLVASGLPYTKQAETVQDQCRARFACIVGWVDVVDEDGNEVAFTPDALKALCVQNPPIFNTLVSKMSDVFVGDISEGEPKDLSAKSEKLTAAGSDNVPVMQ